MKKLAILLVVCAMVSAVSAAVLLLAPRQTVVPTAEKIYEGWAATLGTVFELPSQAASSATATTIVKVPILIYHSVRPYRATDTAFIRRYVVAPEELDRQLSYLEQNGYSAITFDALAEALSNGAPLPPKPVIISFDDGWQGQFAYAFPLLKKHRLAATFFIYTSAIGQPYFMTWKEVAALADAGMAIGGHTVTHPYLPKITDEAILRREIIGGKKSIEHHLGKTIDAFAYPFGHYDDRSIALVKEAGYRTARTTYRGAGHATEDLYRLTADQVTGDFQRFLLVIK